MSSLSAPNYPELPADRNPDAPHRPHLVAISGGQDAKAEWTPSATEAPVTFTMNQFDTWTAERTTNGHGLAFARLFGHICRYSYELACWFVFDGRAWLVDRHGRHTAELRQRARLRYVADAERYRLHVRQRQEKDDDASDAAMRDAKSFANHVHDTLGTPKSLAAMLEAAQSTGHHGVTGSLEVDAELFDRHRHLLNTRNCVVDLRSGAAMRHDPELMLSKLAPVVYVPTAAAPRFEKAVSEIMGGDAERIAFLQRVLGYLITGESRERKVVVFLGLRGSNGKTTLSNILTRLLGDNFVSGLPVSTLIERKFGAAEIDVGLTKINGMRVVVANEPNKDVSFNTGMIKALSGGDLSGLMARRPHQRELEAVKPGAKILLLTNHVPSWKDDQAFNERFLLVPFREEFRGSAERKDLAEELVASEGPGILKWLVDGARMYYRDGLDVPAEIAADTSELQLDATPADGWFRSCCRKERDRVTPVMELYNSYVWHLSEVLRTPTTEVASLTAFAQSLGHWGGNRFRGRHNGSVNPMALVRGIRLLVGSGGQVLEDL